MSNQNLKNSLLIIFFIHVCKGAEIMELAALGRPFTIGMLYDARTEKLVPGMSFWSKATLESGTETTAHPWTGIDFGVSNTVAEKADVLGVDASLTLSLWEGAVSVSGAASYLSTKKTTAKTTSMSMRYSQTSNFEVMHSEVLDKTEYNDAVGDLIATHVVTAIEYGNNAVFDFTMEVSEDSDYESVFGNLSIEVTKFPSFNITAQADVTITDSDLATTNQITVNFYGDFIPDKIPSSYEEALELYETISKYTTGDDATQIPIKVYLHPLSSIISGTATLHAEVSNEITEQFSNTFQELQEIMASCTDLMGEIMNTFPYTYSKISEFKNLVYIYYTDFQAELLEKTVTYKSSDVDESQLTQLLTARTATPFSSSNLIKILDVYESLVAVLTGLTSDESSLVVEQIEFIQRVFSSETIYYIDINTYMDHAWLTSLENYINSKATATLDFSAVHTCLDNILSKKALFLQIFTKNQDNQDSNIKFAIKETFDSADISSRVNLYTSPKCYSPRSYIF